MAGQARFALGYYHAKADRIAEWAKFRKREPMPGPQARPANPNFDTESQV